MNSETHESKRAANIIWNAADNYAIESDLKAYDENEKADLYLNFIIGAVHKYYDYALLKNFLTDLAEDSEHELLEQLLWLGLENCTFEKAKTERPVLESLRQNYAKKVISEYQAFSVNYILSEVATAHFQKILGTNSQVTRLTGNILNDLEFDQSLNTEQIITRMNKIISVYFGFSFIKTHYGKQGKRYHYRIPWWRLFKILPITQHATAIMAKKAEHKPNKLISYLLNFLTSRRNLQGQNIENYYGTSMLPEAQTKAFEQVLCTENHKNCHLHFTRGEFDAKINLNKAAVNHQQLVLKQIEKNNNYYNQNLARNNHNITKLTNELRNTLLINLESSASRSATGKLAAKKIWRNIYLNDNKIFTKKLENGAGDLSVDIMIDASSSQAKHQEMIAAEGYIIAESLTRCQIPVRVSSFRSQKDYTIIQVFRDYDEINKNNKIFNYYAAGSNRDGLAIRAILHMMKNSPYEHRILILLSDGVPNDTQGIPAGRFNRINYDYYLGDPSIKDTALEIRKGQQNGFSILCIFTGMDDDIPAVKKIYGRNFAYIKSQERFADTVGSLVRNELNNR